MATPLSSDTLGSPSHSELHRFHANVKAYGAVGDLSHDDGPAIQAAIDAALDETPITDQVAEVYFPRGGYRISGTLQVGNGTDLLRLQLVGPKVINSANGPIGGAYIQSTNNSANILNVRVPSGGSASSVYIKGLQLVYQTLGGTGICLDLTSGETSGQLIGAEVESVLAYGGAIGIKCGGGVNVRFIDTASNSCGVGWKFIRTTSGGDYSPNVYQFENCYFQSSTTYGLQVSGCAMTDARFASCVFQGNSSAGVYTEADAGLSGHFDSCWWEFPGSDMIRVAGGMVGTTFTSCVFDGSSGGFGTPGARHVFVHTGADNVAAGVQGLTFISCSLVNLNGGYILKLNNGGPSQQADPFFQDITFINAYGHGPVEGLRPLAHGESQNYFGGYQWAESDIIANSVTGLKPPHVLMNTNSRVRTDDGLGAIDFTEVTAPAAGATNHARLYAEDNGAGKTQLVVRFNTGAVQVIATEP